MSRALIRTGLLFLCLAPSASVLAQSPVVLRASADLPAPALEFATEQPVLNPPRSLPRMDQALALETYLSRARRQLAELGSYSDVTVVEADLPSTKQRGRYELRRSFSAPKSLAFSAVRFVGDTFVKSNIIVRLLQSEVDYVKQGEGARTAISGDNYKFKFKAAEQIAGIPVYAYEVKPRGKRAGLFKGKIYVDPYTGSIRRAEGAMVKSPSFFIKKIEFVQDYADFEGFSLPVRLHSESRTRILGTAIVDIHHSDYQTRSLALQSESARESESARAGSGAN